MEKKREKLRRNERQLEELYARLERALKQLRRQKRKLANFFSEVNAAADPGNCQGSGQVGGTDDAN